MDVGAHVSGGLSSALARGEDLGADAVQIFTQSPRMWRGPSHSREALAEYREAQARAHSVRATFCHATYLINLATSTDELLDRSRRCLAENLDAGTAIGSAGVVLHIGSHRGLGLDGALARITGAIEWALDEVEGHLGERSCPLLLENAAGAGGTVGRSFDELARVIDAAGGDERLGVCLDTQHLFASGVAYATRAEADAAVAALDRAVGVRRLGCLHLNDSKVPFAANRDRHANIGEGEIGEDALAWLLGHPKLQHAPAILEVPGAGDGPRASDVAIARRVIADGLARRRRGARGARPAASRAAVR
ncbi:MAG TPA: deoxyribonuclease IV [Acidimicrobiales bacterium]|nr:deoxyribonuclease IV [Acidimicrobiales bacterium]